MTPSTVLELAGLASLIVAAFILAPWLGLVALGVALLVVGFALEGSEE